MHRKIWPGLLGAVVVMLGVMILISPGRAPGDNVTVTLLSAVTAPRVSISSVGAAATPTSGGGDQFTFQFTGVGTAKARIDVSNDGTNWTPLYVFQPVSDIYRAPVCGACAYRAYAITATATDTVTVTATVSGATASFYPTYTPTSTPTITQTPTRTPTVTPSKTPTTTPTKTPTRPLITWTPAPVVGGNPTPTPTATPTRTPTLTPT